MLIGTKKCVEIGAGDGTLSRFLKNAGTVISASDDYSWGKFIHYPDFVEKLSARQTIEKYKPEVVICSWPPPWNDFEKFIFSDDTVKLYIVIGSTNEFASGNRQAYSRQKTFFMKDDKELASLLLPPDVQHAVYLFTKKDNQGN